MRLKEIALAALLAATAVCIHGYHFGVEDQTIYIPAILKHLDPTLFPHQGLFEAQARATLFDESVALVVRGTGIPLEWTALLLHLTTIFLLLWSGRRIVRELFPISADAWTAVAMVAMVLGMPIAGTAQFIADQYLHPRALATALMLLPAPLMMRTDARRWTDVFVVLACFVAAALIHVQMAVFGLGILIFLWLPVERWGSSAHLPGLCLAGLLLAPGSPAWQEAARTRHQHYLTQWEWYEWLGIVAPIALFWWFSRLAVRNDQMLLARFAKRLFHLSWIALLGGMALVMPPMLERLTPFQPMRIFIYLYFFLFLLGGGLMGTWILKRTWWRAALLFVPLGTGMFFAERAQFPASPHWEIPGAELHNDWVAAFLWVRTHTPKEAYFAIAPRYQDLEDEDHRGFAAWARRNQSADLGKDPGIASLVPAVAPEWQRQVHALQGWERFNANDLRRLKLEMGFDWAVIELRAGTKERLAGLECPYVNQRVMVCRL